jgi:hypothetical protein
LFDQTVDEALRSRADLKALRPVVEISIFVISLHGMTAFPRGISLACFG